MGLIAIIITGCMKSEGAKTCTPKSVESEKDVMAKFAADSSFTMTTDATGIMYQVIDPGTGAAPTVNSTVTAKYVGRLLNGKGFDSSYVRDPAGTEFPLGYVIAGWQIGIPKIKEGGKIRLIVPSSLAYGCTGNGPIAPDQPLYFYVELIKVSN